MNIEQANAIPLTEILKQLNIEPVKENEKEAWYLCPWRYELTASFHVNKQMNICFDFGDYVGGDVVKFIGILLKSKGEDHSPANALSWLCKMRFGPSTFQPANLIKENQPKWLIDTIEPLHDFGLIRYLENRGISIPFAKKHLKEVHVRHSRTNQRIWALGFKNDDDGYELRNPFFKSCIAPKTITFIRGTDENPASIHFFEGFMDYLTYLTTRNDYIHEHDAVVLNSTGLVVHAKDHFVTHEYKEGFTWLDNDIRGRTATTALFSLFKSERIKPTAMNSVYEGYKDVNAWHMDNLNLKL